MSTPCLLLTTMPVTGRPVSAWDARPASSHTTSSRLMRTGSSSVASDITGSPPADLRLHPRSVQVVQRPAIPRDRRACRAVQAMVAPTSRPDLLEVDDLRAVGHHHEARAGPPPAGRLDGGLPPMSHAIQVEGLVKLRSAVKSVCRIRGARRRHAST